VICINKKGFTLIELMVVMAIAALLMTGTGSLVRILTLSNVDKVTQKIDSALSKNRLLTMSKGDYRYLVLHWDSTTEEYKISTVTSTAALDTTNWNTAGIIESQKILASKDATISYVNSGVATAVMVKDTPLLLSFYPSSGAFRSNSIQISILIGSKSKTIYLVSKTGNHYIE